MERLKEFYKKYFRKYAVFLFLLAIALNFVIELLARHSLIGTFGFLFGHPVIYLCNVLLIFAILSFAMLFKKRVFATCMLSLIWLILGAVNGIILLNRMTPFTVKDLSNLEDGISIIPNYFSKMALVFMGLGAAALIVGIVLLFRKTPKLSKKINYRKVAAIIAVAWLVTFGVIQTGMKTGVLDTFFGNLAYAYRDTECRTASLLHG